MKKLRDYNPLRLWGFIVVLGVLFGMLFGFIFILGECLFDIPTSIRTAISGAFAGFFGVIVLGKWQRFFLKTSSRN